MNREEFEGIVAEAIEELPEIFGNRIENVEIAVEDWPDRETLGLAGVRHRSQLLGFYYGIPLTERTHAYNLVAPDKISIFRRPILMRCRNAKEVRELVKRVVRHELAHYFGIDDERLHEIGAY